MTKQKSTKRALLSSAIALMVCVAMLIGTTFAWFTDSVTSSGNKIKAGTLKVDLELYNVEEAKWESIKTSKAPIFNYSNWEPGYTDVKLLNVKNNGSLALKWVARFVSNVELSKLANVIDVYVCPGANTMPADRSLAGYTKVGTVADFVNTIEETTNGNLEPGKNAYLGIALKMQEEAGNEYQGLDLGGTFDIQILATQYTSEKDSFDNQYDKLAAFAGEGHVEIPEDASAVEIPVRDEVEAKVGSVVIPTEALADGATTASARMVESTYKANITIAAGLEKVAYDITVEGIKENNTVPVKVKVRIKAGISPDTIKLYHYDDEISEFTYDPNSGYVTFETATFSPFTVVYDAESVYEAPSALPEDLPKAEVTKATNCIGTDLDWKNVGGFYPTEGLDSQLETAYLFKCIETPDQAEDNPYAYWYCDFVVKLDRDLGENEIFLGGNYGEFGWVGFHNGDITLKANEEISLLRSVTTNPWTYLDVASWVGEFTCGVGDVNDSLKGATFTVMLRLTNPENESEFYNVEEINYTF